MLTYSEAPLAYGLARGMAQTVGVDLVRAVTEGWISRDELGALVDTCQHCDHAAACLAHLAQSRHDRTLPAFCPNKPGIEALRG